MATLPDRPNLDQLRHRARDLLTAARTGEPAALDRIRAVSDRTTLAAAQLAVAREYGFRSWARLKTEVEDRTRSQAELAEAFCRASVGDWTGRATRLLDAHPELAGYSSATAVVLGDVDRVRAALAGDPALTDHVDPRTGWTALHLACASRWHQLDPARAEGLVAVARLLLDAGADPVAVDQPGGWTPLRCAVAGAANLPIVRLLLERGARPDDHDLYLAGFAGDDHACLRVLLDQAGDVRSVAEMALAAPMSLNDADGVRLLLDAGADPGRFVTDAPQPMPVVYAAVHAGCSPTLVGLLLAGGADADASGADGLTPVALATRGGNTTLAAMLRTHGAADTVSNVDRFLAACLRADAPAARALAAAEPGLPSRISDAEKADALVHAAETEHADAVAAMLDAGFPIDARGSEAGGTALHAAAYAGAAATVRLLLNRGADMEARDTSWHSTPLVWAAVGSGEHPATAADPDWTATVRVLLSAGASTEDLTLAQDDPKPPSRDVATLLEDHGVRRT